MRDLLRQGETGQDRHAVGEDRACATLAELATVLRTREIQLLAKHLEERVMRLRGEGVRIAVHSQREHRLRVGHVCAPSLLAPMRRESGCAAVAQRSPIRFSVRRSMRCRNPTTYTIAIFRSRAPTTGAAAARTPGKSSSSS